MLQQKSPSKARRGIFFLVLAVALWLFSACGSPDAPTTIPDEATRSIPPATVTPFPSPTPPPGWKIYRKQGFQISLPPTWQEFKLDEAGLRTAIQSAQNNNPPLADALGTLLQTGQYKTLLLYATQSASAPVLDNVSIARVTVPRDTRIETIAQAYAGGLTDAVRGSKLVEVQQSLVINGMDAAEIVYDVSLVNANAQLVTLRGVQYLFLLESGQVYVVTITGDAANAAKLMPVARGVGTSFVEGAQ